MNFDELHFQLAKVQHMCHQIVLFPTIPLLHVEQGFFFFFFFQKSLICYSRIQATTGLGPSEKSCGSVNFNSQAHFAQELIALLQE